MAALPFEAETSILSSIALWNIYEKGITAKEFDAVKPLGLWTFPNAAIHSREPIRTLDDFKGKKLIASNAIAAKIDPGALGATPISFRPDEAYTAIQRGTTDGVLMPFTGMETFKVHEVTKYHLDAALGSDAAMLFINRKRYDALPPKAKEAIDKHSYLRLSREPRREDPGTVAEIAQSREGSASIRSAPNKRPNGRSASRRSRRSGRRACRTAPRFWRRSAQQSPLNASRNSQPRRHAERARTGSHRSRSPVTHRRPPAPAS